MNARRTLTATLVGAVVLFLAGYLIFTVAFAGVYAANAGSATGVDRDPVLWWAVLLGTLAYAALIVYAAGNRAGSTSLGAGARVGAVVGFLLWFTVDWVFLGSTNISTLTIAILDPLLEFIRGGIGGAAIGLVLAKMPAAGSATS